MPSVQCNLNKNALAFGKNEGKNEEYKVYRRIRLFNTQAKKARQFNKNNIII